MNYGVYAIKDHEAKIYHQPQFFLNDVVAVRNIQLVGMSEQAQTMQLTMFPDHFSLVKIATWNDESGTIETVEQKTIVNMTEVMHFVNERSTEHAIQDGLQRKARHLEKNRMQKRDGQNVTGGDGER